MILNCSVSLLVILVVTVLQFSQNVSAASSTAAPKTCAFDSPDLLDFLDPVNECLDLHYGNLLCWLHCFAEKIRVVDSKGNVNAPRMDELLSKLNEGNLKDALMDAKAECLGKIRVIDVTRPGCQGFLKFGLCLVTVIKRHCDNIVQYFRDYTADLGPRK